MPYYTIGHTKNSQLVLKPTTFASVQDAHEYISNLRNSSQYQVYQMDSSPYQLEITDLSGMSLEKYGKGYLLRPPQNDSRWGTKYFFNGWWMPTQNAWFFKSEFYNNLVGYGAVDSTHHHHHHHQTQNATHQNELVGMSVEQYGRGYLLRCQPSHPSWGTKYFLDGWWMPTQNAWFFKSQYYDHLIELGATDESSNEASNQTHTFDKMKWTKYGRGWLLMPPKKHHDVGEKYYHGGWWMPTKNGWFFKNEAKNAVCN